MIDCEEEEKNMGDAMKEESPTKAKEIKVRLNSSFVVGINSLKIIILQKCEREESGGII